MEDLQRRAEDVALLVDPSGVPPAMLGDQVTAVVSRGPQRDQVHARVSTPDGVLDIGADVDEPAISATASHGDTRVSIEVPRSVTDQWVIRFGLVILGLSVVAFGVAALSALWQARRLVEPLDVLADNADRLGRGESRMRPVRSGVPELDRVAEGLERSAASTAAALAAERAFASDASHQLRTPLTALTMRLEEISTSDDLADAREEARVALNQLERLTLVVDSLLARSRTQRRITVEAVDLIGLLNQQIEEWTPAFRERRRRL